MLFAPSFVDSSPNLLVLALHVYAIFLTLPSTILLLLFSLPPPTITTTSNGLFSWPSTPFLPPCPPLLHMLQGGNSVQTVILFMYGGTCSDIRNIVGYLQESHILQACDLGSLKLATCLARPLSPPDQPIQLPQHNQVLLAYNSYAGGSTESNLSRLWREKTPAAFL